MRYCDLHCDALTADGVRQVTGARLREGGCLMQCFAVFAGEGGFARASLLAEAFPAFCAREGLHPVTRADEMREDAVNALLTSEGGAFSTLAELDALYARGVRMAGFVWNTPSAAGMPVFPDYEGLKAGRVSCAVREGKRGLTPFGRAALERMEERGIIPDVSHGSDALFEEVAARGLPFAASHSNAARICGRARNLTDGQIARLADCGGVVGLNFCPDFLSERADASSQREALLAHARHIVKTGGEDVLALGSDFDGAPPNAAVPDPRALPPFLEALADALGPRAAEKAAYKNVMRLFRSVCG